MFENYGNDEEFYFDPAEKLNFSQEADQFNKDKIYIQTKSANDEDDVTSPLQITPRATLRAFGSGVCPILPPLNSNHNLGNNPSKNYGPVKKLSQCHFPSFEDSIEDFERVYVDCQGKDLPADQKWFTPRRESTFRNKQHVMYHAREGRFKFNEASR